MREHKYKVWHITQSCMYKVTNIRFDVDSGLPKGISGDGLPYTTFMGVLELLEYTGFKDRKGDEIYESDIIHRPSIGVPMLVRWNEENACFDLTREPDNFKSTMLWYTRDCHKDYEIIGNIYENPELLT